MQHALTQHDVQFGQQRKGAFFSANADEVGGYVQRVLNHHYNNNLLHDGDQNQRLVLSADMGQPVGFSRNTGQSTQVVEIVVTIKLGGEATLVTAYPK